MGNRESRPVNGLLLLDKPLGLTSNRALQRVRRLYGAEKGGHTGSLDPLATGLLPICLGEATKIAGLLLGGRKGYEGEVFLGQTTVGEDAEGEVIETRSVPELDIDALHRVLERFRGRIHQVPPAHSALKKDGVPFYKLARQGVDATPAAREVCIDEITVLAWDTPRLRLRVACSAGTYIRSLARDIGVAIGCGAHLSALRRTWAEPFTQPSMHTLAELEGLAESGDVTALDALLLPVEAGLMHLPAVQLDAAGADAIRHGRPWQAGAAPGLYRVRAGERLLALAEAGVDGTLRVQRGFNLPDDSLVPDARNPLK